MMSHNINNLSHRAAGYRKNQRRRQIWKRIVSVLGCMVVFLTTYALILPAITLDDQPVCGFEEHRHDSSCYIVPDPVSQLRCSAVPHVHSGECEEPCLYADFFLHSHDTDYSLYGDFVCRLPELEAHTHDESCFTENVPLICGVEESEGHAHGEDCFTESTELTCTESESEAHLHAEACFDENGELVCEIPESEGHTHDEDCFTTVSTQICEIPESEGHTHGDTCFGQPELVLTCDKPVYILHSHDESCFDEDGNLICGTVELLEHIHDENCLAAVESELAPVLICEKTEHTHSDGCFPAPEDTTAATGETDTTDSTESTEVTDPTESTEVTDPTEPTEVTDPTESTEVTDPTESTEVTDPTESTEVTDPTESTEVTDPTESTEVTDPTESTEVTEPTESTEVTDPTESTEITDPTESTEVTEPVVLEVIEKTAVIYTDETYAEISTDATVITVTGLIPADAEIRAYPVTIQSEKEVLCAFDLTIFLPDGTIFEPAEGENLTVSIQAPDLSGEDYYPEVYYIPEDGDPEQIDTTITDDGVQFDAGHFSVYAVLAADTGLNSEEIPTGTAGSYWHSTAYPIYQSSPMRYRKGIYACWVDTFVLVSQDEYGGQTWTPDSIEWTAAGNHNYVVCYCADYNNAVRDGGGVSYIYKRLLSDTSFTADQQAALQRIVTNAYPFISLDEMIQRMNAAGYTGDFNATNVLFGTQKAIWSITDSVTVSQYDSKVADSSGVLNPITTTDGASSTVANTVYNFLINDAEYFDPGKLAVTNTVWSQNTDGSYSVTVTLNRAVLEDETVNATLSDGSYSISKKLEPGTSQFTMIWTAGLPETGNIVFTLNGDRTVFNVYHYDDDGEYQNLISAQYDVEEISYREVLVRSATDVTVVKNWVDSNASSRPESLTIYLTVNGSNVVEEGISPVLLNAANNWTYTWTDLPLTQNGKTVEYSVNEVTPPGYSGRIVATDSNGDKIITITNTYIPIQYQTSLTVTKQWEDGNATHSGQAVIVHLYADGVYTGRDLVLSDATGWVATFDGLPYYQDDGVTIIEYTIVEEKVSGYVPDYGDIGTGNGGESTLWEQTNALEAGGLYQLVANGYALACDSSGNLTAVTPNQEDTYQLWHVASSGSAWTLSNAATGKMVGFNTSYFSKGFTAADTGVALNFSNNRLYYTSSGLFSSTDYYMTLSSGSVGYTTSSSSASTFTLYKKSTVENVPPYSITLTNQLAPSYELPETGGVGTEIFTFGGSALMAAALMWGCTQRRKRERRAA